jgi:putative transcriptional regulator
VVLETLRQTRIEQGKSQTFMSKQLGYKYASGYANIEMGRSNPPLAKAVKIAELLGKEVDELFFEKKLHESSKNSA